MSTVEGKKQEKRRALLDAAYELFLERGTAKTSVEDITSRAKVAKGTFYLYFQDKGAVMQALLGRVSYQLLNNACEAVERQTGLETFPDKMVAVIDHIIEALRRDTVVLKFLERNFVWPGLDQIEASRDAEPLMRKLLNVVLTSPEMAGRTEREVYQRITALGSMCMSVCYSSILEGVPALIAALINIALLVKFTENFRHYFFVILVRSADKFVIAHAHAVPDAADFGGNLVHVPLRRNARGGGFFLYLLPVLVRARLQKHFITLFAFEPGDRVRQNRLVSVADMRLARSVGDCRRHIKFAFVFSGVSFFCHNLLRAPSGRCRNGSTLFIIPRFP